jgi:hypothetical protein
MKPNRRIPAKISQTTYTSRADLVAAVPGANDQALFTNYARFTGLSGSSLSRLQYRKEETKNEAPTTNNQQPRTIK